MNDVKQKPRAVVLVSGGLDSATTLAIARREGYSCFALSFNYGQRHVSELEAAERVSDSIGVAEHKTIHLGLGDIGGSALTESSIDIPIDGIETDTIPVTYVPARNTVFLSLALGWAEVLGAQDIFIGVNAVDYSGYPDCRPEFIAEFEKLANLATKAGVEGSAWHIHAPLIKMTKADIIRKGMELDVDYGQTVSCYDADIKGRACGVCDSCRLRAEGFASCNVPDPTIYK